MPNKITLDHHLHNFQKQEIERLHAIKTPNKEIARLLGVPLRSVHEIGALIPFHLSLVKEFNWLDRYRFIERQWFFENFQFRLNRTRMTRIIRIFTDNLIRAYPRHQCHPCSIS
ncbi:MAG: hypothetical protein Q8M95_09440 [Candidatus Methanoperedens sp.]|nr:hypothetical protein [Candidatus Methanoperedens sp.]